MESQNEPGRKRDAFDELQARIERAIDDLRPKVKKALEELDATVDSALADVKPRVDEKMRQAQPKVEPGFTSLFNGKDFTGWKVQELTASWIIENGAMKANGMPKMRWLTRPSCTRSAASRTRERMRA